MTQVPATVAAFQWALLVALSILVVLMYRQLAYLLGLGRSIGGNPGLELGATAPGFRYRLSTPDGQDEYTFVPGSKPTLLAFMKPSCAPCEEGLRNLSLAVAEVATDRINFIVVTEADETQVAAAPTFRESSLSIAQVDQGLAFRLFRSGVTPFFFAIDGHGIIRGKGAGVSRDEISELVMSATEQTQEPLHAGLRMTMRGQPPRGTTLESTEGSP